MSSKTHISSKPLLLSRHKDSIAFSVNVINISSYFERVSITHVLDPSSLSLRTADLINEINRHIMDLFSPYNHQDIGFIRLLDTIVSSGNIHENVIRDFTLVYSSKKSRLFRDRKMRL